MIATVGVIVRDALRQTAGSDRPAPQAERRMPPEAVRPSLAVAGPPRRARPGGRSEARREADLDEAGAGSARASSKASQNSSAVVGRLPGTPMPGGQLT